MTDLIFQRAAFVPVEDRPLHVPYAYRNGNLNLVLPQVFSSQVVPDLRRAGQLALAGDLLQRFSAGGEEAKRLIIVPSFRPSDNGQESKNRVADLLQVYKIKSVTEDLLPAFVAQIEKEAH